MSSTFQSRQNVSRTHIHKPTAVDLFAGVGGLSLGFEKCGFDVVFANEFDSEIANAYKKNHPHTKMIVGDIRNINFDKTFGIYAGNIDIVIGGPPCQGFSQKGQRKSIYDERNFFPIFTLLFSSSLFFSSV